MNEHDRAVFVISVAAELAGMHPQTLRIYERSGLIDPYRTPGGTRRYSQEDIERLLEIQELSEKGLNHEGIRLVLELREDVERLTEERDRLQRRLEKLRERVEYLLEGRDTEPGYQIVLRRAVRPPRPS
jgi:MerR family transcriptional regulator/heat shock protein HspR